jgi:hypothetical protein
MDSTNPQAIAPPNGASGHKRDAGKGGVTLTGPYFPGQVPSTCGHYYPDVLRLRDEKRQDGSFVRVVDCRYCGRLEYSLDEHTVGEGFMRQLNEKGVDVGVREEELAEVRKRELERLSSENEGE